MHNFSVPKREEVSEKNQQIFDTLERNIGFVPNVFATIAHSENALENYLQFSNAKSSLSKKEKEVVNLVASQINGCRYCQSAHTAIGKLNGYTEDEILEIRRNEVTFSAKTNALANLTSEIVTTKGRPSSTTVNNFFEQGYTKENLIDTVLTVADVTVTNYINNITEIEIDFPIAESV